MSNFAPTFAIIFLTFANDNAGPSGLPTMFNISLASMEAEFAMFRARCCSEGKTARGSFAGFLADGVPSRFSSGPFLTDLSDNALDCLDEPLVGDQQLEEDRDRAERLRFAEDFYR